MFFIRYAGYFFLNNFILLLNSKVIGISTATCHIIPSLTIRKAAHSAIPVLPNPASPHISRL
ncbi:transcription-repair coupling factor domain protein [Anaplasma phagocytophilum str. ApWI1]|uniref:Transcription-repair coupling factor domain protein n=1 Tax=Anaplasma phagocytophilum str. ApWI1 TaxID=1359155 RepID=A0A0F3PY76_ANAPH|nr:transcription-repair coupling factor domain protein [Anaplasma phagocytophilum str. ApWI1]KJV98446.1 transcription-repair coupling factor domain protein [Anaplasma phagocytophilum str. Annie]